MSLTGDLGCGSGISAGVFIETLLITRPARGHVAGCRPRHAVTDGDIVDKYCCLLIQRELGVVLDLDD